MKDIPIDCILSLFGFFIISQLWRFVNTFSEILFNYCSYILLSSYKKCADRNQRTKMQIQIPVLLLYNGFVNCRNAILKNVISCDILYLKNSL